jgi:putative MATE family efflux protein
LSASDRIRQLRERVLYEESLARLIVWLAVPLMVSSSVNVLYEVADTFWLSRIGKAALGTPIVSWPYPDILFGIAFGLSSSVSALVGQYIGAGRFREAARAAGTVLALMLLVTVPGAIAITASAGLYLEAIHVPPDVKPLARVYLSILAIGTPFGAVFLFFSMALSSAGDTKTPTVIGALATLANFILDPILIFGLLGLPRLGVLGAALATLAARMFSAFYAAYSLATGRHGLKLGLHDLIPEHKYLSMVWRISTPQIAQRLAMTLGFMVMAGLVSGLGTNVLAAYSIGQVVLSVDRIISFPFGRATGIVVAQSLGAGMIDRARRALRTGLAIILTLIGTYVMLLMLYAKPFASIFTRDPAVMRITMDMIYIFGPSIIGFTLLTLANIIARSSGHTLFISALGAARLWALRVPLTWLLAYQRSLGEKGLWLAMAISNWATGLIALAWLLKVSWAHPVIERGGEGMEGRERVS